MSIALNGLAPSWKPFVQGVCAREHLPNYAKLWDNLVQEDIRLESRSEQQNKVEDIALVGRTMKGSKKGDKKGNKKDSSPENQYFSQIQCFRCHQLGHYASQCPEKKGKAKSLLYWIGLDRFIQLQLVKGWERVNTRLLPCSSYHQSTFDPFYWKNIYKIYRKGIIYPLANISLG